MTNIEKQIQEARPTLKIVSPLSHWIMLVMGLFNIVFGVSLFLAFDADRVSAPLIIVNEYLSYQFWGVVFMALGLAKLWSLYTNNWNLSRHTLITGVAVKAAWAVALTIRSFVSPDTLLVNFIWVTLALIQMGTYVWFMPPSVATYKQRRSDR